MACRIGTRWGNCRAFTLVELLVVIGILVVLAGGVVVTYEGLVERTGTQLTLQRLQTVRAALLKFRADMGYFPGDGPLAPASLDLTGFYFTDGEGPDTASPSLSTKRAWAAHPLNFWMLYEKPVDAGDGVLPSGQLKRWDFKKESARGWDGPYLGAGLSFRIDGGGTVAGNFANGSRSDRLYAVSDALNTNSTGSSHLRWVLEDRPPTFPGPPVKQSQEILGRPLAFIKDAVAAPGFTLYVILSAGPDGIYSLFAPYGDDVRVEVAREQL